jgi:hypothetical protein
MPGTIATQRNHFLQAANPTVLSALSTLGWELYSPKGILTQSAEAKEKGRRHNATLGIAREKAGVMHLASSFANFTGATPDDTFEE